MKSPIDLAHGWLAKADSDLQAIRTLSSNRAALDAACYHAQQAAEKALKAYLCALGIAFPFTHNIEKLIGLCEAQDSGFSSLSASANSLTAYAVEARYDDEFWPDEAETAQALQTAEAVVAYVRARIPAAPSAT